MPTRPMRGCPYPGCASRTNGGPCPEHAKARQRTQDRQRGTATQRGYNSRWTRAAAAYRDSHPLCVHCLAEGRATPATCVDHITPHRGNPALFWDPANWQSLCDHHHSQKTAAEDGGFGHPIT